MTSSALFGRCLRLFALASAALLAQPAWATINCEITPDDTTTLSANTGDTLSVGYTAGGGGCGSEVTTTTTIITDTTGGSVSPASESTSPGSRNSLINVGSSAGTMVVRITCTAGCFGSPANLTIDYTVTATVAVSRNLNVDGPATFIAEEGTTRVIRVIADDSGAPASTTILWSTTGPVTLSATSTNTDAGGTASVFATFGPGTGAADIFASRIDNSDSPVSFSVTVQAAPVRTITAVSGNNQIGPTRTPAPNPLVVETRDNGVLSSAVGLTWAVVSGDATILAAEASTGSAGQAQATVRFGAVPGPVAVRVSRNDNPAVSTTFALTSTLTRSIASVSGNNQNAPTRTALASPLIVEARDNGLPAPGIGITWSVVSGDATLSSPTSPTDTAGRAQTGLQIGATPGAIVVRAVRADDPASTVDFNVSATFNRTIALISGGNQQGLPGLPLPNPIVIEVRGNGIPEAGVTVNIEVAGDATIAGDAEAATKALRVTDANGRVTAVVTLGANSSGAVSIQASVPASPGVSTTVAATANNLENTPGLTGPERELGGVVQDACAAIAGLPSAQRTPQQSDLLARCQSFAGADPGQIADVLEELLPDTTLAMVNVALQAGQAQLDNLKARIAALRSGTQGSTFGGLALASPVGAIPVASFVGKALNADGTTEAGAGFDRWGYFVSGTIGRGEAELGQRSPAYDFDINGLTAGIDYRFSDGFVAGASLGYTKQDTELDGGEGKVDADGYSLSAYATFYRDESWYTDAVLTLGRNDYDTLRRIRYTITGPGGTSTIDQTARGQLDGDLLSLASTVGRDYQAGTWNIGPYGRLLYSRIDFDAGREVIGGGAGSGLALEIFPGAHTSLASVVGTKFSTALSRDWGILMPHLQVEWEHEYRDDPQRVGARFLADPNATRFAIEGDPIDSSFFRVGGGLSVLFAGGRSGFVYVERVVGKSGFSQTNLALGIRGEF